jgi:diguanylate cyclase (GGDEF)-like protein/PAS domain S-box-containing protein
MTDIVNLPAEWRDCALANSPIPSFVVDRGHRICHWNHALERLLGVDAASMIGTTNAWTAFYEAERLTLAELVVDGKVDERLEELYPGQYRRSVVSPGSWEIEGHFPKVQDGGRWLAFVAAPLLDADGRVYAAIQSIRDITAEKEAEKARQHSEHLLHEIFDGCPVPMLAFDAEHHITHWNRACTAITGVPAHEMIGTRGQWRPFYPSQRPILADLVLDGNEESAIAHWYSGKYAHSPQIPGAWEAIDHFPHFKSGARWLYITAAPIHGEDGRMVGAVETLQDVTAQKSYEIELEHQANHDATTGLPNRVLLNDRLGQVLAHCGREERLAAVVSIDLDNFNAVNCALGHTAGDELLRMMARRIQACTREGDTVARVEGDEFVVVLYAPSDEDAVGKVLRRIAHEIAQPAVVQGESFTLSCSCGVAMFPRDGADAATLLKNAASTMLRAKEGGRSTFHFFTPALDDRITERLTLERDLRQALERDELVLHYQPQISLATGKIVGVEALVRWNHGRLGAVSPAKFIPLAEASGLIIPIGRWVTEAACIEASKWRRYGDVDGMSISVNLSSRQFHHADLPDEIARMRDIIAGTGVRLELELTESMMLKDPGQAAGIMYRLKEMGIRLAMDDFGTGYSSLSYLRSFPFDMIKIDRSFVASLGRGQGAEAIVRAIVQLSRAFDLELIAEGVEMPEHAAWLAQEGCFLAQGYLFSKPLPAHELRALIAAPSRVEAIVAGLTRTSSRQDVVGAHLVSALGNSFAPVPLADRVLAERAQSYDAVR